MKHGIVRPVDRTAIEERPSYGARFVATVKAWKKYILIVVLPTAILATYYYGFAADQYVTETEFIVSSGEKSAAPSGFGQLLGLAGGASQSQSQIMSVTEYLQSHDVVNMLQSGLHLTAIFRRPEADIFSRLPSSDPTPEALLKYYRKQVGVHHNRDTGITSLEVRTFRPEDSYALARQLLQLGEDRVNQMNRRSSSDALAAARNQMAEAEAAVAAIQGRITAYRRGQSDIDPQASGQSQIRLVSELNAQLSSARAQLATMGRVVGSNSPQYVAVRNQIRSLEAEVAAQSTRMTGTGSTIATSLGGYEDLRVRQEFAGKQYEAAAANLETAREDARKQQLYVVRVVNPNMPVKSLYPERGKILLTFFLALTLIYAISWLIAAGVKEHAL